MEPYRSLSPFLGLSLIHSPVLLSLSLAVCALWTPEISFGDAETMSPILHVSEAIKTPGGRVTCDICHGRTGVVIQVGPFLGVVLYHVSMFPFSAWYCLHYVMSGCMYDSHRHWVGVFCMLFFVKAT